VAPPSDGQTNERQSTIDHNKLGSFTVAPCLYAVYTRAMEIFHPTGWSLRAQCRENVAGAGAEVGAGRGREGAGSSTDVETDRYRLVL